jgi:uncharacterized membrane protein YccC
MLINRSDLRLALTAGLATGFTVITSLPFGVYFTAAVLAVCTGTYGGSLSMSWQRIAGTLLGAAVLLASYYPMQGWPFPLAIAVALTLLRLLGGWLGIRGYKVGSFIVIMGWLVHNDQLAFWIPMRLFWTTLGILVGMWSLRLFWSSMAITNARSLWSFLLTGLGADLRAAARRLDPQATKIALPGPAGSLHHSDIDQLSVQRRQQLVKLRKLMPEVANELGNNPQLHPLYRLFRQLDRTSSLLIGTIDGLAHQPIPRQDLAALAAIHEAEASVLRYGADRLDQWIVCLAKPGDFPLPPESAPVPALWERAASLLQDTSLDTISAERLQHLARRALLCRQAIRAIESMEQDWSRLASP